MSPIAIPLHTTFHQEKTVAIDIEIKMFITNPQALKTTIHAIQCQQQHTIIETNTFFDCSQGKFKASDQGLRLRVEHQIGGPHKKATITHKGPRAHGHVKNRIEHEVEVHNPLDAAQLLEALQYKRILSFEKKREIYYYKKCRICLDTIPHIGQFIEIDGPSHQDVMQIREDLGMNDTPLVRASYIAMLQSYLSDNHINTDHISLQPLAA